MESKTCEELAALCGATVEGDSAREVRGPARLQDAGPQEVAFLGHPKYVDLLEHTSAGAVLLARDQAVARTDLVLLRCDDPGRAFTRIVEAFADPDPELVPGVHPAATVDARAAVDPTAVVGPGCVVEAGARIEAGVVLRARVFVGRDAAVGAGSLVEPGVVLYARTRIGARCILHGGAVLGSDGFGFDPRPEGWVKVPQCGNVELGDDVEIGACTTIDRARFGSTRIGDGAKVDNLVHVAHNVQVGPGALLIAQTGIAGSAEIGAGAILAGQSGVGGHVKVGAGVRIGAKSGPFVDLLEPGDYFGVPARPHAEAMRAMGTPKRVERLKAKVADLERRLAALEEGGA
ncbi:MAG: UDP-3-O-(3-hydroxymyristoyl)glucosamine N-acyltransferase [Planctomycetota bacterium]